jgi:hypothetical protein
VTVPPEPEGLGVLSTVPAGTGGTAVRTERVLLCRIRVQGEPVRPHQETIARLELIIALDLLSVVDGYDERGVHCLGAEPGPCRS